MKTLLNNSLVNKLKSKSKYYDVWDEKVKGLHVRVSPKGGKTYRCEHARHHVHTRKYETEKIASLIRTIFTNSRYSYGTRRIKKALAKEGWMVSRRRIGKIMKKENLYYKTKRKFKVTTDSKHNLPVSPNLLNREFTV